MINIRFPFGIVLRLPDRHARSWKPARWWCPDAAHFRFMTLCLAVPRRWWPHPDDGVKVCQNCKRERWMKGGSNMWCPDCALLYRQLTGLLGPEAPCYWLDTVQRKLRDMNMWNN
ncbi:MAG: hypothetical protein V1755_14050 [Chloroflexota bacterium]